MSWAAVVSGKARNPGSTTIAPPTTPSPTPDSVAHHSSPKPQQPKTQPSPPTPKSTPSAPTSRLEEPSPSLTHANSPAHRPKPANPGKPKGLRRQKNHSSEPPSPNPQSPCPVRRPPHQKNKHSNSNSIWSDPEVVATYRLWTQHISSFMAQPVQFFHFFVIDPRFRQSVFEAGLTFHPDTDPSNPVLVNINSTRFGMAERITPLSPPAVDSRANAVRSIVPPPATSPLPVSSAPDRLPVPILQPLPPPHNTGLPFLGTPVSTSFDTVNTINVSSPISDPARQGELFTNGLHALDTLDAPVVHDQKTTLPDASLAKQFSEGAAIEASDSDSERLSEVEASIANGTRRHQRTATSRANRDAHLPPSERRRAGRLRVVSRALDIRIPPSPICKRLSDRAQAELVQQIEEVFPKITPPGDYGDSREDLLRRLRKIISSEWQGAGIDVYGSAGNGLGLRSADVDMSLYMPQDIKITHGCEDSTACRPKVILARLATIMAEHQMEILSKVLDARVPVIKMFDPVSQLQVDVCVNNILAVENTALLKAYVDLDERFRYVCILVKLWAKRRDLNDAYHGTLSSYAYTLLVIHYLQVLEPPVLPCLQQMCDGKRVTKGSKLPKVMTDNGSQKLYNTYYDRTVTRETFQSENHTPVHELLLGFFRYYAYHFNYRTDLASIRLGRKALRSVRKWDEQTVIEEWKAKQLRYNADLTAAKIALEDKLKAEANERRQQNGELSDGRGVDSSGSSESPITRERIIFPRKPRLESKHLFCIEDPFDIDHDLSRGMEKGAVTVIREEMMRAYELIAETGNYEAACEEWM
eukprot:GFKZ01001845.1.p2 GENE.GFKZ01001845.1~~GFKZ01001845.1.p2  ORF type:complete len:813 (-),score=104.15 GFKZ01001845.1:3482-5920(-)